MDITQQGMPQDRCPVCGHELTAATHVDGDARPTEGDVSLCFYCGSFLQFAADLTTREISLEDVAGLPDDIRIQLQGVRRHWKKTAPAQPGEDS